MARKNLRNFRQYEWKIKAFIDYLGISTRNFEQKISVSNGLIARFLTKNTTIQSDVLSKICYSFPELNPDWLITGKGEMLRGSAPEAPPVSTLSVLLERIEDLARENGQLQAENAELKKELARLASARIVSAEAAAG